MRSERQKVDQANSSLLEYKSIAFTPTFIFCSPICTNNCGVVFFVKRYFSFREMIFFVH